MNNPNRREFLSVTSTFLGGLAVVGFGTERVSAAAARKMTIALSPGSIGVSADQRESIRLAHAHGFESVEPNPDYLAKLNADQLAELLGDMKSKGLVFATAGIPVEFRQDDSKFNDGLKRLAALAGPMEGAGVTRWGTWLSPCHNSLTYLENFKLHARRLRAVAEVLKGHGQRLGLEYVGTSTLRERCRYSFIHSMPEMKELIAEIGTGNVGFILDSWHWWQADDTVADLLSLTKADVISVDLNDAPTGVAKDKQVDGRRELPAATGVIDVAALLNALNRIGYDGPVRAEPFNKPLNDLNNEEACAATIAAMKKAFTLIA